MKKTAVRSKNLKKQFLTLMNTQLDEVKKDFKLQLKRVTTFFLRQTPVREIKFPFLKTINTKKRSNKRNSTQIKKRSPKLKTEKPTILEKNTEI